MGLKYGGRPVKVSMHLPGPCSGKMASAGSHLADDFMA
jgi:hypothetical protein